MKSATLPSFWTAYSYLDQAMRRKAKNTYLMWLDNPFHPALRFKCINRNDNIWSVRITLSIRALGVLDGETVTWFWIGKNDEYERFYG